MLSRFHDGPERVAFLERERAAGLAAVTRWVARSTVWLILRSARADPVLGAVLRPPTWDWETILSNSDTSAAVARHVAGVIVIDPDGKVVPSPDLLGTADEVARMAAAARFLAKHLVTLHSGWTTHQAEQQAEPVAPLEFDPGAPVDVGTLLHLFWLAPWEALYSPIPLGAAEIAALAHSLSADELARTAFVGGGPSNISADGRTVTHRDGRTDKDRADVESFRLWYRGTRTDFAKSLLTTGRPGGPTEEFDALADAFGVLLSRSDAKGLTRYYVLRRWRSDTDVRIVLLRHLSRREKDEAPSESMTDRAMRAARRLLPEG